MNIKVFNIQLNIGRAKYIVNHHDGAKVNKDGSPAFDCRIFKNKKKMEAFIKELRRDGYTDTRLKAD